MLEEEKGQSGTVAADIAASLDGKQKDFEATEEALEVHRKALKETQDAAEASESGGQRWRDRDRKLRQGVGKVAASPAGKPPGKSPAKISAPPGSLDEVFKVIEAMADASTADALEKETAMVEEEKGQSGTVAADLAASLDGK